MLQTTIKDTNRTAINTLYSIRNVLAPEAMTALYCRLSVDDANDGDSNSIQNQDGICQRDFRPKDESSLPANWKLSNLPRPA